MSFPAFSRSVQTYLNVLCILRRQETGLIDIDPVLKHHMMNVRAYEGN